MWVPQGLWPAPPLHVLNPCAQHGSWWWPKACLQWICDCMVLLYRAHALIIRPPCLLESLIPLVQSGAPAFLAAQGAPPLQEVLSASGDSLAAASEPGSNKPCLLLVGPEGDFTEQEVKELQAAGARPVGLGPHRLRVETAAIAMVTGAMLHFEQMKEQTRMQGKAELAA